MSVARAQEGAPAATESQAPAQAPGTSQAAATTADTKEIQTEVGDRDLTYLRTRSVFRYDYKEQDGPT